MASLSIISSVGSSAFASSGGVGGDIEGGLPDSGGSASVSSESQPATNAEDLGFSTSCCLAR